MKYKLVNTGRQPGLLYFDSWQINGYEITLEMTVGAGIRVNIRRPPDQAYLHYWFCGGDEQDLSTGRPLVDDKDVVRLVNVAIGLIEADKLHLAPMTTARPFTKDIKFCAFIEPYRKVYVDELNFENVIKGYSDIVERFTKK